MCFFLAGFLHHKTITPVCRRPGVSALGFPAGGPMARGESPRFSYVLHMGMTKGKVNGSYNDGLVFNGDPHMVDGLMVINDGLMDHNWLVIP